MQPQGTPPPPPIAQPKAVHPLPPRNSRSTIIAARPRSPKYNLESVSRVQSSATPARRETSMAEVAKGDRPPTAVEGLLALHLYGRPTQGRSPTAAAEACSTFTALRPTGTLGLRQARRPRDAKPYVKNPAKACQKARIQKIEGGFAEQAETYTSPFCGTKNPYLGHWQWKVNKCTARQPPRDQNNLRSTLLPYAS